MILFRIYLAENGHIPYGFTKALLLKLPLVLDLDALVFLPVKGRSHMGFIIAESNSITFQLSGCFGNGALLFQLSGLLEPIDHELPVIFIQLFYFYNICHELVLSSQELSSITFQSSSFQA